MALRDRAGPLAQQEPAERPGALQELDEQELTEQEPAERPGALQELDEQELTEQEPAERPGALQELDERPGALQDLTEQEPAERPGALQELDERPGALQELDERPGALQDLTEQESAGRPGALQNLTEQEPAGRPGALQDLTEQHLAEQLRTLAEQPGALQDLTEQLRAAEPRWLLCSASPAALGQLAAALGELAAPPRREQDGSEPAGREALLAAAAERAERVGAAFVLLLQRLQAARGPRWLRSAAARPVLAHAFVFARTHGEPRPWSSARSRAAAREVLEEMLRAAGCGSVERFLQGEEGEEGGGFGAVLAVLKRDLTRESWKRNPACREVFSWALLRLPWPWLSPHLAQVLPPALLLSDDFQLENQELGVRCLHHIVLNVPGAELCHFNRAQVLFHALYNHLYSREAPLIQAVLLCLLDLLPVLQRCQRLQEPRRGAACPWAQVLQLLLTHMEAEQRLALRRVYARSLPAFIGRLGILIVRHLKRLERVLLGYLEVSDGPEEEARLATLEALQCTIQHAWPRMPCRLPVLLPALLRLLWDVHTDQGPTPEPVRAALLHGATQCLILLDHCSQGQLKVLLQGVQRSCQESRVRECLRKVQEST